MLQRTFPVMFPKRDISYLPSHSLKKYYKTSITKNLFVQKNTRTKNSFETIVFNVAYTENNFNKHDQITRITDVQLLSHIQYNCYELQSFHEALCKAGMSQST